MSGQPAGCGRLAQIGAGAQEREKARKDRGKAAPEAGPGATGGNTGLGG